MDTWQDAKLSVNPCGVKGQALEQQVLILGDYRYFTGYHMTSKITLSCRYHNLIARHTMV
ncbi:MAG: hypothetical protein WBJ82_05990 [Tepidanaerobacteraceae bacterium]|nr:hypothetical protein [Tepidanaerobacter sp.]